jgi:hypothetical protein
LEKILKQLSHFQEEESYEIANFFFWKTWAFF